jgi:SAM-dependent methyltransferase
MNKSVSDFDKDVYNKIRNNIDHFLSGQAKTHNNGSLQLLDIAPQIHAGAKKYFTKCDIDTADIDPKSNANYIVDICENNSHIISNNVFDIIVCTEVLEHTLNPFSAVSELHRMLKIGGRLLLSTPFDFRIHGPLPDCWRFTEHGLRALLKDFKSVEITPLENENRFLMPYHYTTVAIK